jgi:hypothetical protein
VTALIVLFSIQWIRVITGKLSYKLKVHLI